VCVGVCMFVACEFVFVKHTIEWSYGVMVSTLDFESSDPGSNPGRTSFLRVCIFSTCIVYECCWSVVGAR
jgi:hypothetical protein